MATVVPITRLSIASNQSIYLGFSIAGMHKPNEKSHECQSRGFLFFRISALSGF